MIGIQRNYDLFLILFEDGNFMSFKQIQNKYKILHNHFFDFLQVRHFVQSCLLLPSDPPILIPIESFLLNFNFTAFTDKKIHFSLSWKTNLF